VVSLEHLAEAVMVVLVVMMRLTVLMEAQQHMGQLMVVAVEAHKDLSQLLGLVLMERSELFGQAQIDNFHQQEHQMSNVEVIDNGIQSTFKR
jgi:hypothetical protein